jgi:hypothetical protein
LNTSQPKFQDLSTDVHYLPERILTGAQEMGRLGGSDHKMILVQMQMDRENQQRKGYGIGGRLTGTVWGEKTLKA